jgi:hypothetical protein
MEKFMKIAKKLTKVLVVIIVVVTLVTLGWYLYQEQTDKVDQVVALECRESGRPKAAMDVYKGLPTYYLLESSAKSRSKNDFYKSAYVIKTDWEIPPLAEANEDFVDSKDFYIEEVEYSVIRSNKYIHLFDSLYATVKYIEAQSELPISKEVIEEAEDFDYFEKVLDYQVPNVSFNRETLERSRFVNMFGVPNVKKRACIEVEPSVAFNRVKQTNERVTGGEKKI